MNELTAILDLDWCKYTAAAAGEKRTIKAIHKKTGDEFEFNNRTELYGRKKKVDEGWIMEQNTKYDKDYKREDFTIIDIQTPEPIENVLHTANKMVESALESLGTKKYKGFVGKGDSFRVERSTLLKYKGNRTGLKPLYLDDVVEYLKKKYKAETVTHFEADEIIVMECIGKPNNIAVGEDKDYYGCPVKFYNVNRRDEGIINGNCFGKLWRDSKGDVRGFGRMWMYHQTCSSDQIDNYAANCFSDIKWGDVSSYEALKDAKDDKEAWLAIEKVFNHLYPEPKEVTGWRGDKILIDAEYVMNECFDMARMMRHKNDYVVASDVLKKLKEN